MIHGIPDTLFNFALILNLAVSLFYVIKSINYTDTGKRHDYFRFNILSTGLFNWLLKKRWFQFSLQVAPVFLFILVIAAGLFGVQSADRNIAPVMTWTIWWALLIFDIVLLGRTWCLVCPWYAISNWLKRLSLWKRKYEVFALNLPWPARLKNIYLAIALFIILTWLELGFNVTSSPLATAVLGIVMLFLVLVPSLVFDKMSFCQYGCLIGRVCGLYSMVSPVEVRADDPKLCTACRTKDCLRGNDKGYPCPTSQCLGTMDRNTYCNVCTECIKTCPNDNVSFNIRAFAADLLKPLTPRRDEAIMALVMVALTSFHGLTMTDIWTEIIQYLQTVFTGYILSFTVAMIGILVIPVALFYCFSSAVRFINREGQYSGSTQLPDPFLHYAYALIPAALFYHLSHNTAHIIAEGMAVMPLLSDPFGWGWDLLGTASWRITPLLDRKYTAWIQVFFICTGYLYSLRIAYGISVRRYRGGVKAMISLLVMAACLYSLTAFNIWLLARPMVMRSGM